MPNNRFMNIRGASPNNFKPPVSKPIFNITTLHSQMLRLPKKPLPKPKPKPTPQKVILRKTSVKISDSLNIQTAQIVPPELPTFSESVVSPTTSPVKENIIMEIIPFHELEKLEKEKLEKEKLDKENLEKERLQKERLEKENLEKEKLEKENLEKERLQKETLEKERLEKETLEKETLEKERLEKETLEKERIEKERLQKETLEKERLQKETLEKETLEKERIEKETLEKERLEKERLEKERLEKESLEKEKLEHEKKNNIDPKILIDQWAKAEKLKEDEKNKIANIPNFVPPTNQPQPQPIVNRLGGMHQNVKRGKGGCGCGGRR